MAAKELNLNSYIWRGTKRDQKVNGEMRATSDAIVTAQLRRQGVVVASVKKKPKPLFKSSIQPIETKSGAPVSRSTPTAVTVRRPSIVSTTAFFPSTPSKGPQPHTGRSLRRPMKPPCRLPRGPTLCALAV